jgi:hypothetical protein
MKFICLSVCFITVAFGMVYGQHPESENTWRKNQLLEPFVLAKTLENPSSEKLYLFNIGPVEDIKGCIHIGSAQDPANLEKFKAELQKLPKDATIVIYCGCCPFSHCPNVRPAFDLMNTMGFTQHKLLNLSENLKTDWIDKGYPIVEQ